jgi:hypothetical protein
MVWELKVWTSSVHLKGQVERPRAGLRGASIAAFETSDSLKTARRAPISAIHGAGVLAGRGMCPGQR